MRNYTETQIKGKEQCICCCLTFHSPSRVFYNENNSYPEMSVKGPPACTWAVLITSLDKRYI